MREIKYRQRVNGRFHYWGFGLMGEGTFTGPLNPTDPSDEFTGLRDKHGTEAYEGDIAKAKLTDTNGKYLGVFIGSIVFSEFEWALEMEDDLFPLASWVLVDSFEVIGNIHENPELLK